MFQKIKEYISLLKNTYHSYRTDRLFKKAVRKTATHPDCSFLSWPVEKQSALLDNLKMLSVFYLMTGVTAGDTRTDFEKMPESVRQKGLSLLSSDLQKKLLMMRADDQNRYSFYNFLSAPAAFQNTFLFGLCSSEERLSLLKTPMGKTDALAVFVQKNPIWADLSIWSLQSRSQMDALLDGQTGYRWPEWSLETTHMHLLSLVPFEDLTAFLKKQTPSERTVFESLPFSVQKEAVHRYDGHPHLMQRLMADGLMNHVGWPIKREIALQMKNKKYVLALFKTPTDETGQKGFYATPYEAFRKAVYQKFPELDVYPKRLKTVPPKTIVSKANERM